MRITTLKVFSIGTHEQKKVRPIKVIMASAEDGKIYKMLGFNKASCAFIITISSNKTTINGI